MAPMKVVSAMFVILLTIGVDECKGSQCCTSYTDSYRQHHSPETCSYYCCNDLIHKNYKVCCTDRLRQVSSSEMKEGSCDDPVEDKRYVPALATIIPLAAVAIICYYCCCRRTATVTTVTTVVY